MRDAITGLNQPTGFAFLGTNDVLITEKASGMVKRFTNGAANGVPLDLAVNSNSERGLLAIELHPNFARNGFVYLYWTESTTGADTAAAAAVPDLGNRVDRFVWDGSALTFDQSIIKLRHRQTDAGQPERGNHDGGKVKFGPDGKLYVMIGDVGRRGQMQNLPDGPFGSGLPDDSLGGPTPDDAHLTGVILRLNDDGTAPRDNPFYKVGAEWGGSAGANLQKVFAYGLRNGFGMAFDPVRGDLWEAQNSDDAFSEINRVEAGANLGWIQAMGPLSRIAQFKAIETTLTGDQFTGSYFGLQQIRWLPTNIADTPDEALARMFQVVQDARHFSAEMTGAEEVPAVATTAAAKIDVQLTGRGTLRFKMTATGDITGATQAHFHLAGRGQNGTVVAFLLPFNAAGQNFRRGRDDRRGGADQREPDPPAGVPEPDDRRVGRPHEAGAGVRQPAHPGPPAGGDPRPDRAPRPAGVGVQRPRVQLEVRGRPGRRWGSSTAGRWAGSTRGTCSSARPGCSWRTATCSGSTCRTTARRSSRPTRGWRTRWRTTTSSSTSPKVKRCCSAATSASPPRS